MTLTTSACERPPRRPPRPARATGARRSPAAAQRTPARRIGGARTRYLTSALSPGHFASPGGTCQLFPPPPPPPPSPLPPRPPAPEWEPQSGAGRGNGGGWGCRGVAGGEGASVRLHPINQAGTILSRSLGRGFWDANAMGERQRPVGGGGGGSEGMDGGLPRR